MNQVISKILPYAAGAALAVISALGGATVTDSFAIITSEDSAKAFCELQKAKNE